MCRRWRFHDDAVTSLIGTILMVAITVVTASLAVLLLRGFGDEKRFDGQSAGAQAQSPRSGELVVTLTVVANPLQTSYAPDEVIVTMDSSSCPILSTLEDANGDGRWEAGESFRFDSDCEATPSPLASGSTHLLTVAVKGTPILLDTPVRVR